MLEEFLSKELSSQVSILNIDGAEKHHIHVVSEREHITSIQSGHVTEAEAEGAEIVPTYFTSAVTSRGFHEVAETYFRWILGLDGERNRHGRLSLGVHSEWTVKDLQVGKVDLTGSKRLAISVRANDEQVLIRFSHPDARLDGNEWWNLARISQTSKGTQVEHGLIRFSGEKASRPGPVGVPRIVQSLLRHNLVQTPWEVFNGDARG